MKLIESAADSAYMAEKVADTGGVYMVPAFAGLGTPYWDPYARGVLVGLTRGTNKYHIIRASLESIAYQTKDILSAMEEDSGIKLQFLKVDGGASANDFLMQFQADIIGTPVKRPTCLESTALGAACLAGLAAGYWKDEEAMRATLQDEKRGAPEPHGTDTHTCESKSRIEPSEGWTFIPQMSPEKAAFLLEGWSEAVKRSMGWEKH